MKAMWAMLAALGLLVSLPAYAACSFGSSSETSLQGVFDTILPSGSLSATQDCLDEGADSNWTATGQAIATIVIELAGFSNQNTFGIYDAADPTRRATIFAGSDGAGTTDTVQIMQSGGHYSVFDNGVWAANFSSSTFGFFLSTPQNNVFTSNTALNSDGGDHMYAYRGNGGTFVGGTLAGATFASSMYLLAFEDLAFPNSDRDYQDFVAAAQFVVPVPIPASGLLLAAVLALLLMHSVPRAERHTFV
jgi:hypothetical protein